MSMTLIIIFFLIFLGWGDLTSGPLNITMLDGGHFYLKDEINTKVIHKHIAMKVDSYIHSSI